MVELLDHYSAMANIKPVTRNGYFCAIRSLCKAIRRDPNQLQIEELQPDHFIIWRKELVHRLRLKRRSIMSYETSIRMLLKFAIELGYLSANPVPKLPYLKTRKQIRIIQNNEHLQALQYLEKLKNEGSRRYFPQHFWIEVIHALSALPVRAGQLVNLRWRDVNLKDGTLVLHGTVRGAKGSKNRVLPIPEHYLARLRVYRNRYEAKMETCGYGNINTAHVFHCWFWKHCEDPHEPDAHYRVQSFFWRISKHLGIHIHAHQFRHSIATKMCEQGVPLNAIQEILGHEDIQSTTIYLHSTKTTLEKHLVSESLIPRPVHITEVKEDDGSA